MKFIFSFVKIEIIKSKAAMVMEHIAVETSPSLIPKHTQINIKMNINAGSSV